METPSSPQPVYTPPVEGRKKRRWISPVGLILGLSVLFFILFVTVSAGFLFSGNSTGTASSPKIFKSQLSVIGILEVKGTIMDSKKWLKQLRTFEDDQAVKGVILRIDSPGGAVGPSQEMYDAFKRFPKPIYASMGSVAASGGYYIAMGAKKVYANPGTITGSIGVIMQFVNLKKLYEWAKVERYDIRTGRFKGTGAEYRDMDPEARKLLQEMVDDVLLQFKTAVSVGRKLNLEDVTAIADGRIFSGAQAKALKLIDEVGGLDDAVNALGKELKIDGRPKVVYGDKPHPRWMNFLMDDGDEAEDSRSNTGPVGAALSRLLGIAIGGQASLESAVPASSSAAPGIYFLWN